MKSILYREEIEEIISRLSYKPDWTISLKNNELEILSSLVPDANKPWPAMKRLEHLIKIPEFIFEKQLVLFVRERIIVTETHEVDEWLKLDNENIVNPHLEN